MAADFAFGMNRTQTAVLAGDSPTSSKPSGLMNKTSKIVLILLGVLSFALILSQVGLALWILNGAEPKVRTMHQHSGYLMATISLIYVVGSLAAIASSPSRSKP